MPQIVVSAATVVATTCEPSATAAAAATGVVQTTTPATSPLDNGGGVSGDVSASGGGAVVVVVSGAGGSQDTGGGGGEGAIASPSRTAAIGKTVVIKTEIVSSPTQSIAAAAAATTATTSTTPAKRVKSVDSHLGSDQAAVLSASFKKLNRFSDVEKALLYGQFKEHQQIIDIKQRRSSYSSHKQAEVRACWERIVDEYNAHPDTQNRTMRQIQKFWLNSKLRNQIPADDQKPFGGSTARTPANKASKTEANPTALVSAVSRHSGVLSSPAAATSNTTATIVKRTRTLKNDGTIVPTYTIQPMHVDGLLTVKDASGESDGSEQASSSVHHHQHHQHQQQQQQQQQHLQQQHHGSSSLVQDDMIQDEEMLDDEEDAIDEHGQPIVESELLAESEDGGVEDMIELKFIDAQQQQQQQQQPQHHQLQQHHHHQQQQQAEHTTHRVQVHENGTASLQLLGHSDRAEFANLDQIEIITPDDEHQHHQQHHHYTTATTAGASVASVVAHGKHQLQQRRLFCGSDCGTDRDGSNDLLETHQVHQHHHHHTAAGGNHQQHQQQQQHHQHQQHHEHTAVIDEGTVTAVGDSVTEDHLDEQQHGANGGGGGVDSVYADQINELRMQEAQCRLQEAQCRVKEAELRCEAQQVGLYRANEDLRHQRELHVLQISEMQLKLDKMKKELRLSMT